MSDASASISIQARALFDEVSERLALQWVAGDESTSHTIHHKQSYARRPSLVGYLNIIYPNRVQIMGTEELRYLDSLDARERTEKLHKVMGAKPLAIIITRGHTPPDDLLACAKQLGVPVWTSDKRGHELLALLQYHLTRKVAKRTIVHGVFLEVYSVGLLITGPSGGGKSELALELVTRGHRLVADDAPEFTQIAPDIIDGTCPAMLQDMLEVRGLGMLNIRQMFGETAVKTNKYLKLIINLLPVSTPNHAEPVDRLRGDMGQQKVLDLMIPTIQLPVAPGRNLAVLVEAAVRAFMLQSHGINTAQQFLDRHVAAMQASTEDPPTDLC